MKKIILFFILVSLTAANCMAETSIFNNYAALFKKSGYEVIPLPDNNTRTFGKGHIVVFFRNTNGYIYEGFVTTTGSYPDKEFVNAIGSLYGQIEQSLRETGFIKESSTTEKLNSIAATINTQVYKSTQKSNTSLKEKVTEYNYSELITIRGTFIPDKQKNQGMTMIKIWAK